MCQVIISRTSLTFKDICGFLTTKTLYYKMKDFGWYYCAPSSEVNDFKFLRNIKKIALKLAVDRAEDTTCEVFTVGFQNNSELSLLTRETEIANKDVGAILPFSMRSDGFSSILPDKKGIQYLKLTIPD